MLPIATSAPNEPGDFEQHLREEVTDGDDDDTRLFSRRNRLAVIDDSTVAARIGEQQPKAWSSKRISSGSPTTQSTSIGSAVYASDGLRLAIGVDEKARSVRLALRSARLMPRLPPYPHRAARRLRPEDRWLETIV